MKKKFWPLFVLILCAFVCAAQLGPALAGEAKYLEGSLLVTVDVSQLPLTKDGDNRDELARYVRSQVLGDAADISVGKVLHRLPDKDGQVVALLRSDSASTEELIAKAAESPQILGYARNYANYPSAGSTPNDPRWSEQWGPAWIEAQKVWGSAAGGEEVIVAVLDTGIMYDHEDLAANMYVLDKGAEAEDKGAYGVWFYHDPKQHASGKQPIGPGATVDTFSWNDADKVGDVDGHGSHVAGIIGAAANNGVGIAGVARNVKLLAFNVYSPQYSGETVTDCPEAYDAQVIEAMDYVLQLKEAGVNVRVVNMSFGSWRNEIARPQGDPFGSKIKELGDHGIVVVVSAGNEGQNIDSPSSENAGQLPYPACFDFDSMLTVASVQSDGKLEFDSNYSTSGKWVDVAAPGYGILSTVRAAKLLPGETDRCDASGYMTMSGTSMAAPHASAAAAILCSLHPEKSAAEIVEMIKKGAYAGVGKIGCSQHGALDVFGAFLRGTAVPAAPVLVAIPGGSAEALTAKLVESDQDAGSSVPNASRSATGNGYAVLQMDLIDSAMDSLLGADEAARNVAMLPLFTAALPNGSQAAACAFEIEGLYLGDSLSGLLAATVDLAGRGRLLKRVGSLDAGTDGTFAVLHNGQVVDSGSIAADTVYTLVFFAGDNGASDVNAAKSALETQALLFTKHAETQTEIGEDSSGGGGGCNAFFFPGLAALLALGAALKAKSR